LRGPLHNSEPLQEYCTVLYNNQLHIKFKPLRYIVQRTNKMAAVD
jgi:hypothetical protein